MHRNEDGAPFGQLAIVFPAFGIGKTPTRYVERDSSALLVPEEVRDLKHHAFGSLARERVIVFLRARAACRARDGDMYLVRGFAYPLLDELAKLIDGLVVLRFRKPVVDIIVRELEREVELGSPWVLSRKVPSRSADLLIRCSSSGVMNSQSTAAAQEVVFGNSPQAGDRSVRARSDQHCLRIRTHDAIRGEILLALKGPDPASCLGTHLAVDVSVGDPAPCSRTAVSIT